MSRLLFSSALLLCLFSENSIGAEACESRANALFICGTTNPEDLYQIPDTPWVIASGRISDVAGPIYAVNAEDFSVREIFPANASPAQHDRVTYPYCPGPNPIFQPHGVTFREGSNNHHTLYVVGHGAREAIEVFNVDVSGESPSLSWIGCIISPSGTKRINSITALPNGSLGATNFDTDGGELWEWHPTTGWIEVPGSQMPGPNGLVSSEDGQWFYVGGWSEQALVRLSRGSSRIQIDSAPVGFNVDNVRVAPDGKIVVAGHVTRCPESVECELSAARVAMVHPETLEVEQIIDYKGNNFFRLGTVAIEIGDEIWIGGIRGSLGIARFSR